MAVTWKKLCWDADLTTHMADTTTHGTTGAIVGLSDTQELTNKTLNASVGKGIWTASGTWTLPAMTLGGLVTMGEVGIKLDETLSADGKYCGIICAGVAGATVVYKELLYLQTSDQRWEKAIATAEATAGDVLLAIALSGGNDGDAITLLLWGYLREDDFNFTSYGQALFIDASTAGAMTQTAPSGSSQIVRVVGYAHDDADTIFFCPSPVWIETAA